MIWTDNMLIPTGGSVPTASTYMNFVYEPEDRGADRRLRQLHLRRSRALKEELAKIDPETREQHADLPRPTTMLAKVHQILRRRRGSDQRTATYEQRPGSRTRGSARDERLPPPPGARRRTSCSRRGSPGSRSSSWSRSPSSATSRSSPGSFPTATPFTWAFVELLATRSATYHEQFVRSSRLRRASRRSLCLLLAYPLVYWIAFRGGRWKNLFLLAHRRAVLRHVPVRTLAWLNILADEGPIVVGVLQALGHPRRRTGGCSRRVRRRRGDHLQLPPVHGASALRLARADRRAAARGGGGSLREPRRRRSSA